MSQADRPGLLLINLGTPSSPAPSDVRPYLREFLSDPRVIDLASWKRWLLLNLIILPFRPRASAEAYAKIWTDRGSPLLFHLEDLAQKVRRRIGDELQVEIAMRYGEPSMRSAIRRFYDRGISRIAVFPLYPQYSSASTGSSLEQVFREASRLWNVPYFQVVPPFFGHPAYIRACAEQARPVIERVRPEKVFFSFHGVPEDQIRKGDPSGQHCLRDGCCETMQALNSNCYRAQCFATARLLADELAVPQQQRVVSFQSRLGRRPWIRPYTDVLVRELAGQGVRRAVMLSPAFVADCLETLEELGIRAVEDWKAHGGEQLAVVPCVNSSDSWAEAVVRIAAEACSWLPDRRPAVDSCRAAR